MKKKIISLLLVLALCLGMTFSVSAEDAEGFANDYCRVQDMAGLMTDSEEAKLNDILDELSIRQKMDVVVVTTNTLDEKTVKNTPMIFMITETSDMDRIRMESFFSLVWEKRMTVIFQPVVTESQLLPMQGSNTFQKK